MSLSLGKKALDMLDYNGYSFMRDQNKISFKHSSSDRVGLIIMLVLCLFVSVFLFSIQLIVGLGALLVCVLIFTPLLSRSVGKLAMSINKKDEWISINQPDTHSFKIPFNQVAGIFTRSKFVDEYSSAFKSTSKEYQVTIGLEMDDRKLIPIFKLIADHEKPSKEMNEVAEFLRSEIKK